VTAVPDPITAINLLLCIMIFLLGYFVYRKQEKISALVISIAFGMFGLSHFSILTGIAYPEFTFILLRVCGYILVAAALWLLLSE
jgi:lipopolysaccharide export LptBFGC system permease protein LptF